jgi:hypothetical protein
MLTLYISALFPFIVCLTQERRHERLINELKTRARLWLTLLQSDNANARKRAQVLCRQHRRDIPDGWQLRHCLNLAAADIGFSHWEHARHVLSGQAQAGDDMGDFWHGRKSLV